MHIGFKLEITVTVTLPFDQWINIKVNKKEAETLPKLSPPPLPLYDPKPETQVKEKYKLN